MFLITTINFKNVCQGVLLVKIQLIAVHHVHMVQIEINNLAFV